MKLTLRGYLQKLADNYYRLSGLRCVQSRDDLETQGSPVARCRTVICLPCFMSHQDIEIDAIDSTSFHESGNLKYIEESA